MISLQRLAVILILLSASFVTDDLQYLQSSKHHFVEIPYEYRLLVFEMRDEMTREPN